MIGQTISHYGILAKLLSQKRVVDVTPTRASLHLLCAFAIMGSRGGAAW
ncbi:MAG: hypothetical protein WB869_08580 [Candidatus Acidiferrales bacterium]